MKSITFPGGIHPPYFKDISLAEPLRKAPLPDRVAIPLLQHIGAPNEPVVNKGDYVEDGQLIGKSDSFISSPVHSSISGAVKTIEKYFHPTLGPTLSVIIDRDKTKEEKSYREKDISDLSPEQMVEKVELAGLAGMGGAAFPTHVKLSVPKDKKIRTVIINGAECEPYLTCDHALMTRKTQEILKGIEIMINILEPERTYLAIEDNKKASIFAFEKLIKQTRNQVLSRLRIISLKTKYPQGGEKQLIKAISGKEVPPGKLPLDIGFLVQNVGTVYAMYEAVYMDKPLIERVVTVSGDCLSRPGNYLIKIGTTIKDIVERYGVELYRSPKKIIVGGPMTGFAQPGTDAPVIKGTSGILFLSEHLAKDYEERQCIRCAKCVDVCPVNLLPTSIMKNVDKQMWDQLEEFHVDDCMECGACSFICPSRIPLVHYIKSGKEALRKIREEKKDKK